MRIGLLPGTFDPLTKGHLDIIQRARLICDRLIIAIGTKPEKKTNAIFSLNEKIEMLQISTRSIPALEITHFQGLVTEFAREKKASFLIRGLRFLSDFEKEFQMALTNRRLSGIETVFLMADEKHAQISSSLIREIAHFGGPLHDFVPAEIEPLIRKKFTL